MRCNAEESITHLFFQCPYAAQVAPISQAIDPVSFNSFQDGWNCTRKIHSLPPTGIEAGSLTAWICWSIWISRNQLVFQKRNFSPAETIQKALFDAREWKLAQISSSPRHSIPAIRTEPNPRRPEHCVVFTDAAWNSSTGDAGLGWIIDDQNSSSELIIGTCSDRDFCLLAPYGRNLSCAYSYELCLLSRPRFNCNLL